MREWKSLPLVDTPIDCERIATMEAEAVAKYPNVQFLDMGHDEDGNIRRLAYVQHAGSHSPGVIVVPGYFSGMDLPKTTVVEDFCKHHGFPFVKYESEGTGVSPGVYKNITYRTWVDDAMAVLDRLSTGPQILVASSLGSWTATMMALRRPERIHSILHIGLGPIDQYDGTYAVLFSGNKIREQMPPKAIAKWDSGHVFEQVSSWGVPVKYWKRFLDDIPADIPPNSSIPITCPVRLLHAFHDDSISYKVAIDYLERLESKDVDLIIRKSGNHRLMKRPDRKLIIEVLQALIHNYPVNKIQSKL